MKANKTGMFSVEISRLEPEAPAPFPLYVFLKRNDRMVPLRLKGDPIGIAAYEELKEQGHAELWVPKSHEEIVRSYLELLQHQVPAPSAAEQAPSSSAEPQAATSEEIARAKGESIEADSQGIDSKTVAQSIKSALKEPRNEGKVPASISAIASVILRDLYAIDSNSREEQRLIFEKCRAFADEFLIECAQQENLFREVWAARSFQRADEHGVAVGSVSALIAAVSSDYSVMEISELISAAALHDIGLISIPKLILQKPLSERTTDEQMQFNMHVEHGVRILSESADPVPENVVRIVSEHHEKTDGTGFPKNKTNDQLLGASKNLIATNAFDDYRSGKHSGAPQCPRAALDWIMDSGIGGEKLSAQLRDVLRNPSFR
jgi:HD-GYP domain-containing protein (c-di-GMP phosphodiesterase class II)